MDTPEPSSYSRQVEGPRKDAAPRGMTAESDRPILGVSWQPAVCGDKTSSLEVLCYNLAERLVWVEEEMSKKNVWLASVDTRLQFLESCHRQRDSFNHYRMKETSNPHPPYQDGHRSYQEAFPGGVTQKELQEKEEYKKLKEKNKELEAKNKELLAKAMGMHKNSENMNDPSCFSAVLHAYEMLRLRGWEQFRTSTYPFLTYETGSSIIRKLFAACEKDIRQRIKSTLAALGIPSLNDTMTDSKEGVMEQIRSLLRYSYHQDNSELVSKIVMQTGIDPTSPNQREFVMQCCQVYCLLLLQNPPVEAVWNPQESLLKYSEHVDKKDREYWRNPKLLWPVMKGGEQVIEKGVVWDEK